VAHRYPLTVVADDLDSLGHVNNARYLDYLERGRTQWYDDAELVERCAEASGINNLGTVVVNVNIDFRDECTAGDELVVLTSPARVGGKSFTVVQRIEKAGGGLSAEAQVTSVVMDLDTRSAIKLPDTARALFACDN
tara:strand:+ start:1746 stop:2156 length:411 start_codon:yes stop_codon:yes gene_type:complete